MAETETTALRLNIHGMTCAVCSRVVEQTLTDLPGVSAAQVNLATNQASLSYDASLIKVDNIIAAIIEAGYGADPLSDLREIRIPIGGMTCAVCARTIEIVLNELEGVNKANVNLATEKATVIYDPDQLRISIIKAAIQEAGYEAKDIETDGDTDHERLSKEREAELNEMKHKTYIAIFFAIPLFYLAMAPMVPGITLPFPDFLQPMDFGLRYALVQAIIVAPIIWVGRRFYSVGFRTLAKGHPNMDSLIAVGTLAALIQSLWATWKIYAGDHMAVDTLYFESAGLIIALILFGKTLEANAKGRASQAISKLVGLAPKSAIVLQPNGNEVEIAIAEVEPDDILLVKPGESIPVDGVLVEGETAVDESMLTGESLPIDKIAGDSLIGASINKNGLIKMQATRVGSSTTLSQIIRLVEEAQGSKAPIAKLADDVAGIFVPIVFVVAIVSGLIWLAASQDPNFALSIFIAVLVIACPCALGLATPTAIMIGTGKGAENGILIKNGEALEMAKHIQMVVFDKTGTITEGHPLLTDLICEGAWSHEELLTLIACAEKGSEHPLGEAIVKAAEGEGLSLKLPEEFLAITGQGIIAKVSGREILIGNQKMMHSYDVNFAEKVEYEKLSNAGKTLVYLAVDREYAGVAAIADVIKESSYPAIKALHDMGIETAMMTGDNKRTANAIAVQAGIDRVLAEVLPQDKAKEVQLLQQQGLRVAMIGDGINDAPALAMADLGIAVGSGTDVAIESADVVLIKSDLRDVSTAIELSRATLTNIKQNLFWAFFYNTLGIPLAAGLFYAFGGPLLNPIFAAAAMSLSSVSVVSNALRLRNFKPASEKNHDN